MKTKEAAKSMLADMLLSTMLEHADEERKLDLLILREHKTLQDELDKHIKALVLCENNDSEEHKQKKKEFLALFERIVEEVKNFDSTICLTSADAENT